MDGTPEVTEFAETLERVCAETVEAGKMISETTPCRRAIRASSPPRSSLFAAIDENLQAAMA